MGIIDVIVDFFGWSRRERVVQNHGPINDDILPPSDDIEIISDEPSTKRIKLNQENIFGLKYFNVVGNMSPKQYFNRRKVPQKNCPEEIDEVRKNGNGKISQGHHHNDTIDGTSKLPSSKPKVHYVSVNRNKDNSDDIQVLPKNVEEGDDVKIIHEKASPRKKLDVGTSSPPELKSSSNKRFQNKENNISDDDDDDADSVQIIGSRCPNSTNVFQRINSYSMFPRRSGDSFGSSQPSYIFKRRNRERTMLKEIETMRSRDAYAKLIEAIKCMNGDVSTRNTTPSSDLDVLDRLATSKMNPSSGSVSRASSVMDNTLSRDLKNPKYVSISNGISNISRRFVDIKTPSTSTDTKINGFRFLDAGPKIERSTNFKFDFGNSNDKFDEMIQRIESIDLHRHERNIARKAIEVDRSNAKVRNLEVPTYNILIDKTINLRKVPERLQVKKVEKLVLPDITEELENGINRMRVVPRSGVVAKVHATIGQFSVTEEITKEQILTLEHTKWLNDAVINSYLTLIMDRGVKRGHPKTFGFNTFFYTTLSDPSKGYARVKRWTKKVDFFSFDLIVIPIHVSVHWCLATIDFRNKSLTYYDSMGGSDNGCLKNLMFYLEKESLDKKGKPFDTSPWTCNIPKDIPQQQNSFDCGVFTCIFAEYISRNTNIDLVNQKDMPYYRKKMMAEILTGKLLT